jgi:uncharacterized membrane protein YsdA (DUF1294 family)
VIRGLVLYLALVNVLAYAVYWRDKRRAETGKRRIAERELLLWAAAGGSLGAWLAMRRFRHKTRKTSFRVAFYGVVAIQAAILWLALR